MAGADLRFEQAFAEMRVGLEDAALAKQPIDVMVAHYPIHRHLDMLLRFFVQGIQLTGAFPSLRANVIDQIAARYGKVGSYAPHRVKRHTAAMVGIELVRDVGFAEVEEAE